MTRKEAKEATLGVIDAVCIFITFMVIVSVPLSWAINRFSDTDPTDASWSQRSGLKYYKDYGTGIEYVSSPNGTLIVRVK